MRILIIFFILLSNSLEAQKNDLLILDGVKYKGKLLNYSKSDISSPDSGKISFFIYRLDDTLNISSDRNLKLKINRYSEFYEFTKKSWNNIEYGINTGNFSTNTGAFILNLSQAIDPFSVLFNWKNNPARTAIPSKRKLE